MSSKDRKPRLGQQLVYLHCRTLFVGDYTRMRSLESIKEFLVHRKHAIPVLFDDYPLDKVCSITQRLLIDGLFESEIRARGRFPLLFDPSRLKPSQEASSNTKGPQIQTTDSKPVVVGVKNIIEPQESRDKCSQIETSGSKPEVAGVENIIEPQESRDKCSQIETSGSKPVVVGVENIIEPQESRNKGSQIETSNLEPGLGGAQNDAKSPEPSNQPTEQAGPSNPPLQQTSLPCEATARIPPPGPVYPPYATQVRILRNVLACLDGCCFEFAAVYLPDLLVSQRLETPEQLTLTQWVSLLMQWASQLPDEFTENLAAAGWKRLLSVAENLDSMIGRRRRTCMNGMIDLLDDAILFTRTFKDPQRNAWCQVIREKLRSSLMTIQGADTDIREKLSRMLEKIARQQAALDAMSVKGVAQMVLIEQQNRTSAFQAMDHAIHDFESRLLFSDDWTELDTINEAMHQLAGSLANIRVSGTSAEIISSALSPKAEMEAEVEAEVKIGAKAGVEAAIKAGWSPPSPPTIPPLAPSSSEEENSNVRDRARLATFDTPAAVPKASKPTS